MQLRDLWKTETNAFFYSGRIGQKNVFLQHACARHGYVIVNVRYPTIVFVVLAIVLF